MRRYFIALVLVVLPCPAMPAEDAEVLAVIVPVSLNARVNTKAELAVIFMRKKLYWPGGRLIHPANLPTQHALRRLFSQRVLGTQPASQTEYWNELYFHGTSPPHVVNSEEAMLRFVAEAPGAIGYVDACMVDERVKTIAWVDADGLLLTPPVLDCQ